MDASDDLQHRYCHLRRQLDAAYAAADWDSSQIDRITAQMAPIERALALRSARGAELPVPLPDSAAASAA